MSQVQNAPPTAATPIPVNPVQTPTTPVQGPAQGGTISAMPPVPSASAVTPQVPTVQGNNTVSLGNPKSPVVAAVLNWFILGAGYVYLGMWKKALLFWGALFGCGFILGIISAITNFEAIVMVVYPIAIGVSIYSVYDAYQLAKRTQVSAS